MATRSAPSLVLLDRFVDPNRQAVQKESEWTIIKCSGVDEDDSDSAVDGLTLLARLADPPDLSALSIRLSGDAFQARRRKRLPPFEFDDDSSDDDEDDDLIRRLSLATYNYVDSCSDDDDGGVFRQLRMTTNVEVADDRFIVLTAWFRGRIDSFYLIYDATKQSLSMIREPPSSCKPYLTRRPLPVHRGDGDGSYALALIARISGHDRQAQDCIDRDVLCLWPPPPSSCSCTSSIEQWQLKKPHFPSEMPHTFVADVVFSSKGQAFWADLGEGVLFCNSEDVLSGGYDVQFRYIQLPSECRLKLQSYERDRLDVWRTMSCVGDSIKFVCISSGPGAVSPGDAVVTMWTLNPTTWQWWNDGELRVASLWELEDFKKAGLPRGMPTNPILSTQEDDVLYFVLDDDCSLSKEATDDSSLNEEEAEDCSLNKEADVRHIFSFNMRTKSFMLSRRVPSIANFIPPDIMGFDFFKYLDSECLCPLAVPSPGEAEVSPVPPKRDRGEAEVLPVPLKRKM